MIYCFDIDGTICTSVEDSQYQLARPFEHVIREINRLHDAGNVIKLMTARGSVSGKDYTELTQRQLADWGIQYHQLIMNAKPHAHLFVDDRAIHIDAWLEQMAPVRGIVAGAFDLIHPGYVRMFAEAKRVCTHLTVALHIDPSIQRPAKLKPVLTVEERATILQSIRYVDAVVNYATEDDLYEVLEQGNYDLRFIGDDYRDQPEMITGGDLNIAIHWIDRSHSYSTTSMKRAIYDTVAEKRTT
jgi:glycerol-3-phosphate cytidylyltransferase